MAKSSKHGSLKKSLRSFARTYFPWHPYYLDFDKLYAQTSSNGERMGAGGRRTALPVDDKDELQALAATYRPTKAGHDYIRRYAFHFGPIRHQVRRVVEIGVQQPVSMLMWESYFPNATIFGIDIDPACKAFEDGRKRVFIGDQKDAGFLREVLTEVGGAIDIVIDDGEHSEPAILKTFPILFPALADHGIYAIEDIQNLPRVSRFLRQLEGCVNYWPEDYPESDWPRLAAFDDRATWLDRNIVGLHFYRYLCLIERGYNPEDNAFLPGKQA